MTYMYKEITTWNPYKGCNFDCVYCEKSFKQQAKRQKHRCADCYNYVPHFHPERLKQYLPKNKLIFCCGNGDIAFANPEWLLQILQEIRIRKEHTFLLQTKKPSCLNNFDIPDNCIVGTTIETNRDTNGISKAPNTTIRFVSLEYLDCRKFVTHEPIMNFDLGIMVDWDKQLDPEMVWVGYANHNNGLNLDEPELSKTKELIKELESFTDIRLKTIRDKNEKRV